MVSDRQLRAPVRCWIAAAMLALQGLASAQAADYPKRPVTVVVPMGAGAGPDLTMRLIAKKLEARLGQPFVVENRAGMSGSVGAASVARAAPDGHTIMLSFLSLSVFNPVIYKSLQYGPDDLEYVSIFYEAPFLIANSAKSGTRTFDQLVQKLRSNPPGYSYASGGVGSAAHVGSEMFLRTVSAGGVVHVPYRTTSAIFPDLISDRVAFAISTADTMGPYIRSGDLHGLAVSAPQRLASLPEVPTMAEVGAPDLKITSWYGVQVPTGTPRDIMDLLAQEIRTVLQDPELVAWFRQSETTLLDKLTPGSTAPFIEEEKKRWAPYLEASGARSQ